MEQRNIGRWNLEKRNRRKWNMVKRDMEKWNLESKAEQNHKIWNTRQNNQGKTVGMFLSTATRALMIGVAVIIVCIVCSLALYMSKQGKTAINTGTNQYNKMLEDYQDLDRAMYDGLEVSGNEVGSLILRMIDQGEYIAVRVKTKASDYTNYNYYYDTENNQISNQTGKSFLMALSEDKGAAHYINPKADFLGKVIKNANGSIICIEFVQQ